MSWPDRARSENDLRGRPNRSPELIDQVFRERYVGWVWRRRLTVTKDAVKTMIVPVKIAAPPPPTR